MNIAVGNNGKLSNADKWSGSIPQGLEFHHDNLLNINLKTLKREKSGVWPKKTSVKAERAALG